MIRNAFERFVMIHTITFWNNISILRPLATPTSVETPSKGYISGTTTPTTLKFCICGVLHKCYRFSENGRATPTFMFQHIKRYIFEIIIVMMPKLGIVVDMSKMQL